MATNRELYELWFIDREDWEKYAEATIPTVYDPNSSNKAVNQVSSQPMNAVNGLSSALSSTIFPTGSPIKLSVSETAELEMASEELQLKINRTLAALQKDIEFAFDAASIRATMGEVLKSYLILGSGLLSVDYSEGVIQSIPMTECSWNENRKSICIRRIIERESIEERLKTLKVEPIDMNKLLNQSAKLSDDLFYVFELHITDSKGRTTVTQQLSKGFELNSQVLQASKKELYPMVNGDPDVMIRHPLGLVGQNYKLITDLFEATASYKEALNISQFVLFYSNSDSPVDHVSEYMSGEILPLVDRLDGDRPFIDANVVSFAREYMNELEQQLAEVFGDFNQIVQQRSGITAAEIHARQAALEARFAGTYSLLSNQLSSPVVNILKTLMGWEQVMMAQLQSEGIEALNEALNINVQSSTATETLKTLEEIRNIQNNISITGGQGFNMPAVAKYLNAITGLPAHLTDQAEQEQEPPAQPM